MAYNTSFTRRKSSMLFDLDCRTTGPTRTVGALGETLTFAAYHTLDEAIEQGECIAMVRVPAGFMVTGAVVAWEGPAGAAPAGDTIIGFGDPYACGRLSNRPIDLRWISQLGQNNTGSFQSCGVLTKCGKTGDGCGLGYVYTCETDLVITNLYGLTSHDQGGWKGNPAASGGGVWGGAITSGTTIFVEVRGIQTSIRAKDQP